MTTPHPPGAKGRFAWLAVLYLGSGGPYGLLTDALPTYLRRAGVGLPAIGRLTSDISLPWTLKFLWAPLLDLTGRRLWWSRGALVALTLLLFAFAEQPVGAVDGAARILLIAMAVFAATQDIAVDAYTIQAFPVKDLGTANAVRTTAYRVGMILCGGLLVGRADALGWPGVWRAAAAGFAVIAGLSFGAPTVPHIRPMGVPLVEAVKRLAAARGFIPFAAFVLLFKAGDAALAPMTKPFLVDHGLSNAEIGDWLTPLGLGATIAGGLLGGILTSRWGLWRALWLLALFQAVSNLGYAAAALGGGKPTLWAAAVIEPFCGGLGTAPFLALLMASCDAAHAGTQFALWTALMSLGKYLAGRYSGDGVEAIGYAGYFALTFVASLPAFALLPWVRRRLDAQAIPLRPAE